MKKCELYYDLTDVEIQKISNMQYIEGLEFKISNAKILLVKLINTDLDHRDFARINKVCKAIKFNEDLIKEVKGIT